MAKKPVILALDTSSHALVCGLSNKGRIVLSRTGGLIYHSEKIFETLLKLMKRPQAFRTIDLIAVGLGPGSFTGIRVGVTVAKTLAYSLKTKLCGISSLEVIAAGCDHEERPVCVVQDARRSRVYTATYQKGRCLKAPRLLHFGDFLYEMSDGCLYVGDGLERLAQTLNHKFGKNSIIRDRRKWYPKPLPLLQIASERLKKKRFNDPMTLSPEYLYPETCNITQAKA